MCTVYTLYMHFLVRETLQLTGTSPHISQQLKKQIHHKTVQLARIIMYKIKCSENKIENQLNLHT
mgnify:CR=1 FL=1